MSDLLERVSRAIYQSQIGHEIPDHFWEITYKSEVFLPTIESARAAIAAMRVETDGDVNMARHLAP